MPANMAPKPKVHGDHGVWCGGDWIDIEDADQIAAWQCAGCVDGPGAATRAPPPPRVEEDGSYDVAIIGAGCIGAAIARELSKYSVSAVLIERDDDVTQGATKGNSGIVHAGFDDEPGTNRARLCWKGNQMFAQLDKELRFGFLRNGSLVIARSDADEATLKERLERGRKNGVRNLRIISREELVAMEPHVGDDARSALYSPDAGTVTPYEYTIALAENAAANGVQVLTRHEVVSIAPPADPGGLFAISALKWPRGAAVKLDGAVRRIFSAGGGGGPPPGLALGLLAAAAAAALHALSGGAPAAAAAPAAGLLAALAALAVAWAARGGAGPSRVEVRAKYVVNCAGLFSDKVAAMVGDTSFKIKPRVGDYLILNKSQGHLAGATLFPAPDPVKGKGVLVQTTLWGNLILGPTARDMHKPEDRDMTPKQILEFVLQRCRELVPSFDAGETYHSFAGARAKSDRGDWIIEESEACRKFFHAAGIDSPGLAGSPAIAMEIVSMLQASGLSSTPNKDFDPIRPPIIVPKRGWKGLKLGKAEDPSIEPRKKVICKCEKVTESEIVDAVHRAGGSVDTTQHIRRRTRAGMGHCQAGEPTHCEAQVAKIISRELRLKERDVGRRPWPATSILPRRWLSSEDKDHLRDLKG